MQAILVKLVIACASSGMLLGRRAAIEQAPPTQVTWRRGLRRGSCGPGA
jgi:hypothetical protein